MAVYIGPLEKKRLKKKKKETWKLLPPKQTRQKTLFWTHYSCFSFKNQHNFSLTSNRSLVKHLNNPKWTTEATNNTTPTTSIHPHQNTTQTKPTSILKHLFHFKPPTEWNCIISHCIRDLEFLGNEGVETGITLNRNRINI